MLRNIRVLKKLLGEKQYKELIIYTRKRVKDVFGKQSIIVTKKLIYANNSAVLIIALLKARKYSDIIFFEKVNISSLQNNEYLIQNDINEFIKEYSKYINIIEESLNIKNY